MKIALASAPVLTRNVRHNLISVVQTIAQCHGEADLVLFGEAVLQGFDCLNWDYESDCCMAVAMDDPSILQACQAARENRIGVSFGYIEKSGKNLFSSQIVIDCEGRVIHNYHRVSPGWKEPVADSHYVEGEHFESFFFAGKKLAIGLCGDLWMDGRPEEMRKLNADVVLWPVWTDYDAQQWNNSIKYEYALQADLCGNHVLLVNPFCADPDASACCAASGGAVHFQNGSIVEEASAGKSGILIVEI